LNAGWLRKEVCRVEKIRELLPLTIVGEEEKCFVSLDWTT